MRFGGYEIGDKVVYTNSFTKPTLGKVVYYINENYLIDFTNNTRKWATDKELIRYSKENYLKRIVEKYLKVRNVDVLKIILTAQQHGE